MKHQSAQSMAAISCVAKGISHGGRRNGSGASWRIAHLIVIMASLNVE